MLIEHDYADKQVKLFIQLVEDFIGEPQQQEGQLAQWVAISELSNFAFPEANKGVVDKLLEVNV